MLDFLQSNLSLVAGGVLVILLIAMRAGTSDKGLRTDLGGAIGLLFASVVFREIVERFGPAFPIGAVKLIRVLWMLTFAFGLVRAIVSVTLWLGRVRTGKPTPKILRDVVDFTLYALCTVPILKSQLDFDLTGLVATSALLSLVLGLALQDTLGNLFAGLAIQLERPFHVGDFVRIGEFTGQVVQIGWRATRIETVRQESITLPNNILSKQPVQNFSRGARAVGQDTFIGLSYATPPNLVKQTILEVLKEIPQVVADPHPVVRPIQFDESSVKYQVRYFVADYTVVNEALDELYTRLWYRLRREGIEIPFPHRTVVSRKDEDQPELSPRELAELLHAVDLFHGVDPEDLATLAHATPVKRFGRNERVITQGDPGSTFYVVVAGEVSVRVGRHETEVSRLRHGQYFGEGSLLTGEPRNATVVALTDAVLLEVQRPTFSRLFANYPNLAKHLSALLTQRRNQIKTVEEQPGAVDAAPEAGRIFTRLRQIFGLGSPD